MLPAWSPSGNRLAFFSENRTSAKLFVYEANSGEVNELVSRLTIKKGEGLSWSPNGQKLAVLAIFEQGADICIVDFTGFDSLCLAESKHIEGLPSWSFDGSRLIYSAFDIDTGAENIYVINADGSERTQITFDGGYQDPVWLWDSDFFVCEKDSQGASQIMLLSIDGFWEQAITPQIGGISILKVVVP
jgi:TolB protein